MAETKSEPLCAYRLADGEKCGFSEADHADPDLAGAFANNHTFQPEAAASVPTGELETPNCEAVIGY